MVKMVDCHKQFSFHKWKIETSEEKYWNETNQSGVGGRRAEKRKKLIEIETENEIEQVKRRKKVRIN